MNILKEWERDPPNGPVDTMTGLWYDFKRRRRDPKSPVCRFRDNIPDACAAADSPYEALSLAVRSIRPNGKMHNHQSKVSKALPALEERLMESIGALTKATTFGQLYSMIELRSGHGIGPMTIYDVAVRFGAYLGVKPDAIYLHAGTLAGLKALGLKTRGWFLSFPMELLPAILRNKDPDEVEDFLCTYRLAFERLRNGR
jgi:hypothetical protein